MDFKRGLACFSTADGTKPAANCIHVMANQVIFNGGAISAI
jgi:hypothetical protein